MLGSLTAGQAAIAASHDEMQTVAPDSVGIDSAAVAKLAQDIRAGKYSNIHSLLVVRFGPLRSIQVLPYLLYGRANSCERLANVIEHGLNGARAILQLLRAA
jgi:hypothetical protein